MTDPLKKSFIINEGLRIRDQHEVALDFITLDQPINKLEGDMITFKYSMLFACAMMFMAKFLFSIYIPTIIQVFAVGVFVVIVIPSLFAILESYNKAVSQYVYSTMALYLLFGAITLILFGLF